MEVRKRKKDWVLTGEAFDALLTTLDAEDRERAGEKYEKIRRKLLEFFEARGCRSPSDHTDETINRVARKISEGEEIDDVVRYFYGVARLVVKELYRARDREIIALDVVSPAIAETPDENEDKAALDDARERHFECCESCLKSLPPANRDFITEYYRVENGVKIEGRQRQAKKLRIPLNALRLRAFRIRAKLDMCLEECLRQAAMK